MDARSYGARRYRQGLPEDRDGSPRSTNFVCKSAAIAHVASPNGPFDILSYCQAIATMVDLDCCQTAAPTLIRMSATTPCTAEHRASLHGSPSCEEENTVPTGLVVGTLLRDAGLHSDPGPGAGVHDPVCIAASKVQVRSGFRSRFQHLISHSTPGTLSRNCSYSRLPCPIGDRPIPNHYFPRFVANRQPFQIA